jgi:hypothetical protein
MLRYTFDTYNSSADLTVWADDAGGGPGSELTYLNGLSFTELDTGQQMFGREVCIESIDGNGVVFDGGTVYWIGFRTYNDVGYPTYNCTSPVTYGDVGWFYWPDAGYSPWNTLTYWQGENEDFSFCVLGESDPCHGVMLGDSDGSGHVDFNDINCFVTAMIDDEGGDWADCGTLYPPGAFVCANDTDHSGHVDFNDIDSFVDCLVNDDQPCP